MSTIPTQAAARPEFRPGCAVGTSPENVRKVANEIATDPCLQTQDKIELLNQHMKASNRSMMKSAGLGMLLVASSIPALGGLHWLTSYAGIGMESGLGIASQLLGCVPMLAGMGVVGAGVFCSSCEVNTFSAAREQIDPSYHPCYTHMGP